MKKLNNELKKILSEIQGNILMIGNYDGKITDIINENNNILFCDILSNTDDNRLVKNNDVKKQKKVNIRKLKKRYKKNKLDYLIVDEEQIKDYKNIFVKDSIYIASKKIYIIPSDQNVTLRMYRRYSKKINIIDCVDGKVIEIDHGNGFKTKYAHLNANYVKKGDNVSQGQAIGEVGSTGRSTGPHLHYEILYEGVPMDPMVFIKAK